MARFTSEEEMENKKHKVYFVHIPRTGGTSVERAFRTDINYARGRHTTGWEYKLTAPNRWHDYTKFTIVRNPYERLHSFWKWTTLKGRTEKPFEEWIHFPNGEPPRLLEPMVNYLTGDEKVMRFEQYAKVISLVESLGAEAQICVYSKTDKRPYQDDFTDRAKEIVKERYEADLKRFGYCFEGLAETNKALRLDMGEPYEQRQE